MKTIKLRSSDHPEANGRTPENGDIVWKLKLPLEKDRILILEVGKKGRDTLFGMMIADCHDSGEPEPC